MNAKAETTNPRAADTARGLLSQPAEKVLTMTKASVTESAHQEIAGVIEVHRNKPMVSSLKIAELFERPHKNVLRVLRELSDRGTEAQAENRSAQKGGLLKRGKGRNTEISAGILKGKISWSAYQDDHGREQPIAWLSEREALIAMPFFGGQKAHEGQRKLVDAYLHYRNAYANPPRRDLLTDKRRSGSFMCEVFQEIREEAGKETQPHHYGTEYKLCNWALTGEFKPLDESKLDNGELALLQKIRAYNTSLIQAEIPYAERKPRIAQYAIRQRTKLLSAPAAATE